MKGEDGVGMLTWGVWWGIIPPTVYFASLSSLRVLQTSSLDGTKSDFGTYTLNWKVILRRWVLVCAPSMQPSIYPEQWCAVLNMDDIVLFSSLMTGWEKDIVCLPSTTFISTQVLLEKLERAGGVDLFVVSLRAALFVQPERANDGFVWLLFRGCSKRRLEVGWTGDLLIFGGHYWTRGWLIFKKKALLDVQWCAFLVLVSMCQTSCVVRVTFWFALTKQGLKLI